MRLRTLLFFTAPSAVLMLVFIFGPLISVAIQSLHTTTVVREMVKVETCSPGFLAQICTTTERSQVKMGADGKPLTETRFTGFDAYRAVLKLEKVAAAFSATGQGMVDVLRLDFWRALRFTLTFTFITLPLVVGFGLVIALAVNNAMRAIRGPLVFVSLLPFVITPVIGALAIRWLFVGDGIVTAALRAWIDPSISFFAQGWTIELLMLVYRVWHNAPFAFIIFYAGLQTVDQDTLESAVIDGASRWERLRYVVVPHLAPLIVFVSLIHLMDAYRVFEEVVGFGSEAHVISLQWLTFNYLMPDFTGNRYIARASASSMLTLVGIVLLLIPLLRRVWRDNRPRS
jgi:multiple sugar transport system permease protein